MAGKRSVVAPKSHPTRCANSWRECADPGDTRIEARVVHATRAFWRLGRAYEACGSCLAPSLVGAGQSIVRAHAGRRCRLRPADMHRALRLRGEQERPRCRVEAAGAYRAWGSSVWPSSHLRPPAPQRRLNSRAMPDLMSPGLRASKRSPGRAGGISNVTKRSMLYTQISGYKLCLKGGSGIGQCV